MAYALRTILPVASRFSTCRLHGRLITPTRFRFLTTSSIGTAVSTQPAISDPKVLSFNERFLQISLPKNPHNAELQINSLWLRDHCRCSVCYNSVTNQRSSDIVHLRNVSGIAEASIESKPTPRVAIVWNDGHRSIYSLDWIDQNWCNPRRPGHTKPILWRGSDIVNRGGLPIVSYTNLLDQKDAAMKRLFESIMAYGVACISDVPATFEETQRVCQMVALPEETVYGKFWQFCAETMEHADTAYSTAALGAHTDLTYYAQTAGLQVFHLLEHSGGEGGATLLVDGFNVAEQLRTQNVKAFQFLATTPIPCHYLDAGAHYFSEEPVIKIHALKKEVQQIRFNVYDRAPLNIFTSNEEIEEFYSAYITLAEIVRKPENEFWVKLEPGTIIFIDNFRVLHGRSEFTGKRTVCGCYLQRDNFLSKARILSGI